MKNKVTIMLLFALVFCGQPGQPAKNKQSKEFYVPEGVINVRSGPGTKYKKVYRLHTGDVVKELKRQDKKVKVARWEGYWVNIDFKGKKGWVLSTFIRPKSEKPNTSAGIHFKPPPPAPSNCKGLEDYAVRALGKKGPPKRENVGGKPLAKEGGHFVTTQKYGHNAYGELHEKHSFHSPAYSSFYLIMRGVTKEQAFGICRKCGPRVFREKSFAEFQRKNFNFHRQKLIIEKEPGQGVEVSYMKLEEISGGALKLTCDTDVSF